jgi:hypothetical protein
MIARSVAVTARAIVALSFLPFFVPARRPARRLDTLRSMIKISGSLHRQE